MKEVLFWAHVAKMPNGCWLWTGATRGSYPAFGEELAHVWAYKNFVAEIPEGHQIDHTCHNDDLICQGGESCKHRLCVNYERHLEAVTPAENNRRGRGNQFKDITCCKYNHEFTEENTYYFGPEKKYRGCRTCRNARRQGKDPATYVRHTVGHNQWS